MRSCNEASRGILDNSNTAQVLSDILSPAGLGQGRKECVEIQTDLHTLRLAERWPHAPTGLGLADMRQQGQAGTDSSSQGHCHVLTSTKFLKFHKFPEWQPHPGQACECWRPGWRRHSLTSRPLHSQSKDGTKEYLLDKINRGMNAKRQE